MGRKPRLSEIHVNSFQKIHRAGLFLYLCLSSLWCELAYWSLRCTATHSLQHDTVRVRKALEIISGGLETTVHHIMSPHFCAQESQKHDPLAAVILRAL
jgi:hypothetical protein